MSFGSPGPADAGHSGTASFWYRAVLLCRKELRETLRDRRTIITLLAMPLLLYPLLGMVFRFMAVSQLKKAAAPEYLIALGTDVEALWLKAVLEASDQILQAADEGGSSVSPDAPRARLVTPDDESAFNLTSAVSSADADLGIIVQLDTWNGSIDPLPSAAVRLISNRDSPGSREALRYIDERLQTANLFYLLDEVRHYDQNVKMPVRIARESVTSDQKSRGFLGLLPLVLLLMTVTGGVYPAIDLTAGERERDTLETLIALPIPRVQLLLAKYVAVFSVTLLTGMMNILAMTATVYTLRMETQLFGDGGLTIRLAFALLMILIVFGLFYSAVLLALTSSSRSFKEAQAYLIPLMLLSIAPGLVILLPGWHLEGAIAVAPLVNMLLLARDVFEGTVNILPATAAVISTLIYAALALTVAAQIFGTDAVAVGSRGTWSDLWKRPRTQMSQPPLTTALVVLALMFPLYFFANGLLSRTSDDNPQTRLLTAGALTILLFGGFPLSVAVWRKLNLVESWQLRFPRPGIWPAAVILGLGTWPWIYEMVLTTSQLGLAQLDEERLKQVADILERWREVPLVVMVISLGVLPGIFEELFFRGFLLSSLRQSFRPWPAILLCGLIFGVFHVIAAEGAAFERLLPSASLGCLLSWIAVRSNSVLPGMLLHVLHNSSLLVIAHYRDDLSSLVGGESQQEHLPAIWLLASAVAIVLSISWVVWQTRPQNDPSSKIIPRKMW